MIRKHRHIAAAFLASDLIATLAALSGAYWLRFRAEIVPIWSGVPDFSAYIALFPLMAAIWPIGGRSPRRCPARVAYAKCGRWT